MKKYLVLSGALLFLTVMGFGQAAPDPDDKTLTIADGTPPQAPPLVLTVKKTVPIIGTKATMTLNTVVSAATGEGDNRNVIHFAVKIDNTKGDDPITPKARWFVFSMENNFTFEVKDAAGFSYTQAAPGKYNTEEIEFSGDPIDPGDFSSGIISIIVANPSDPAGFRIRYNDGTNKSPWIAVH